MMFQERKSAAMRAQLVSSMRLLILGAIRTHGSQTKAQLKTYSSVENIEELDAFDEALEQLMEESRVSAPYLRVRDGFSLGVAEWSYNSPTSIPGVYP
jgi:hypothetical protein